MPVNGEIHRRPVLVDGAGGVSEERDIMYHLGVDLTRGSRGSRRQVWSRYEQDVVSHLGVDLVRSTGAAGVDRV